MMGIRTSILLLLPGLALAASLPASLPRLQTVPNIAPVVDSLNQLRTRLAIPGLAAAIVIDGQMVWRGEWGNLTTTSLRDVASVTKTMAAVIAMQQVERGQLGLQDAVPGLPGVQVRHLLSHTSVGRPGETFHYNNLRYGALTAILERGTGQSFARLLQARVLSPAGMRGTRPGTNSISGVVSHVEDLARFMAALDGDEMLGERQKQWMWMPMGAGLPYALGWYSQSYLGQRVVWHYGQLNGYGSSLVVKIPGLRANLVVLSNSSLLSDAYHLESGDILRSPLGRSFLAALVDPLPVEPLTRVSRASAITSMTLPILPPKRVVARQTNARTIVHGAGF